VRALQHLLTHSYSGKVLAVRRVTENDGKKTPGVDREIWDTPEKKTWAVHELKRRGYQPQPLRRVYILKSDGKTMRPLAIPTMMDRATQALHLLALDPVAETTADKNSYGFRQQRSCADAIQQCFNALTKASTQWVLEGDIRSCFDRISHDWLVAHVPMDRAILQKWLKSGYMDKHVFHETTEGTPQGGIATPLTQKVISSSNGQSRAGEQGTRCLTSVLRGNMYMTYDAFDQNGKGSTPEHRSWSAPASNCAFRSCAAVVTQVRFVRASSISLPGGRRSAGSSRRSSRGHSADHDEASAAYGGTSPEVREKQRTDHWSNRDRRIECVSAHSKKAWLSRVQKAAHFKSTFPIRLIACSSRSSRRPTIFWCPLGSAPWAGV
jgi:Reverse transcriptase (RNA-dependent DNA polymerase)/N-terminal domain of reverse transcriptase